MAGPESTKPARMSAWWAASALPVSQYTGSVIGTPPSMCSE